MSRPSRTYTRTRTRQAQRGEPKARDTSTRQACPATGSPGFEAGAQERRAAGHAAYTGLFPSARNKPRRRRLGLPGTREAPRPLPFRRCLLHSAVRGSPDGRPHQGAVLCCHPEGAGQGPIREPEEAPPRETLPATFFRYWPFKNQARLLSQGAVAGLPTLQLNARWLL